LDTEDSWILRYLRSRFFTFLFFTPKISGNGSGKKNESCRIFHYESKKKGLHFYEFSTIFYGIYKIQQIGNTIEVSTLRTDPWKDSAPYNVALAMADGAGSRIPAAPAMGSAGEECGEGCELTRDRFAGLNGVDGMPAGAGGGIERRPPLERLLRRVGRCRLRAGALRDHVW
jgi:hypothetical protein